MDQAIIHTPDLRIRRDAVSKSARLAEALREVGRYQVTLNNEGDATWVNIKVGPNIGARLVINKVKNVWNCSRIHLFTPNWIWGHNARTICDHETLLRAFERYLEVVSVLVEEGQEHLVLPGIGPDNTSYWHKIEFPIHVPDPGSKLLRAFARIDHPAIHDTPLMKPGSYVSLKGTELAIKAYDKLEEHRGLPEIEDPILRIEVTISGSKLAFYLNPGRERKKYEDLLKGWPGGFSLETLYKVFRRVMGETAGVFVCSNKGAKSQPFRAVLARVHSQTGIPMQEIEGILLDVSGQKPRTIRDHMTGIRKLVANEERLELVDFFPEALVQSPGIFHPAEESLRDLRLNDGPIRESIRRCYHDANSRQSPYWRPSSGEGQQWNPPRDPVPSSESDQ